MKPPEGGTAEWHKKQWDKKTVWCCVALLTLSIRLAQPQVRCGSSPLDRST